MTNNQKFAERLHKIMDFYQLTASSFADEIKVQRSSISHLLSGRNKPSLDFVLKVLEKFSEVDLYWLLNGKGSFPKKQATSTPSAPQKAPEASSYHATKTPTTSEKEIDRIIIFYKDGTFQNYNP
tara:strand:+ start:326793 stop:327167 length:375 start_codon:yes stop_codon:yes gene_type:complete